MTSPAHAAPSLPAVVVLVRHADKASDDEDAPLLLAGSQRAQDLMRSLAQVKLSAIVTTQFIRSKDTAKPVATAQGINPSCVKLAGGDAATVAAHVAGLKAKILANPGGAVLVIGHNNTVPRLIAALGGPDALPDIEHQVFDRFYVLLGTGAVQLIQSRYGAPSP